MQRILPDSQPVTSLAFVCNTFFREKQIFNQNCAVEQSQFAIGWCQFAKLSQSVAQNMEKQQVRKYKNEEEEAEAEKNTFHSVDWP